MPEQCLPLLWWLRFIGRPDSSLLSVSVLWRPMLRWLMPSEMCRPFFVCAMRQYSVFIADYRELYERVNIQVTHCISHFITYQTRLANFKPPRVRRHCSCRRWHVMWVCSSQLLDLTLASVSLSLRLTDERAIRLHQKVQPDSLIWQPFSNRIYSLFLVLHHLDKKEKG